MQATLTASAGRLSLRADPRVTVETENGPAVTDGALLRSRTLRISGSRAEVQRVLQGLALEADHHEEHTVDFHAVVESTDRGSVEFRREIAVPAVEPADAEAGATPEAGG